MELFYFSLGTNALLQKQARRSTPRVRACYQSSTLSSQDWNYPRGSMAENKLERIEVEGLSVLQIVDNIQGKTFSCETIGKHLKSGHLHAIGPTTLKDSGVWLPEQILMAGFLLLPKLFFRNCMRLSQHDPACACFWYPA